MFIISGYWNKGWAGRPLAFETISRFKKSEFETIGLQLFDTETAGYKVTTTIWNTAEKAKPSKTETKDFFETSVLIQSIVL